MSELQRPLLGILHYFPGPTEVDRNLLIFVVVPQAGASAIPEVAAEDVDSEGGREARWEGVRGVKETWRFTNRFFFSLSMLAVGFCGARMKDRFSLFSMLAVHDDAKARVWRCTSRRGVCGGVDSKGTRTS